MHTIRLYDSWAIVHTAAGLMVKKDLRKTQKKTLEYGYLWHSTKYKHIHRHTVGVIIIFCSKYVQQLLSIDVFMFWNFVKEIKKK